MAPSGWGVRCSSVGSLLAPPGSTSSSRILHLLCCRPPHQSALCQGTAPELSAGGKRLRKQVRKNWSRTESRWRAGSSRQAEGRQAEPGMLGQHFSAGLPGWPRPRQARPPLQPSSQLPRLIPTTLPRGEAEPEEPPRTGIGSRLGGCDRGKMCSESVWNRSTTVNQKGGEQHILGVERSTREIQTRLLAKGVCGAYLCQFVHGHSHHPLLQPDLRATPQTKSGDQRGSGARPRAPSTQRLR